MWSKSLGLLQLMVPAVRNFDAGNSARISLHVCHNYQSEIATFTISSIQTKRNKPKVSEARNLQRGEHCLSLLPQRITMEPL